MLKLRQPDLFLNKGVCFFLVDPKDNQPVWCIGAAVDLVPPKKPGEKVSQIFIRPQEIGDIWKGGREMEEWETSDAPYFQVPNSIIIMDLLQSRFRGVRLQERLKPMAVDIQNVCLARPADFMAFVQSRPKMVW